MLQIAAKAALAAENRVVACRSGPEMKRVAKAAGINASMLLADASGGRCIKATRMEVTVMKTTKKALKNRKKYREIDKDVMRMLQSIFEVSVYLP